MPKTPTYEQMRAGWGPGRPQGTTGLRGFLRGLKPGVPKQVPDEFNKHTLSSEMTRMGYELQCRFIRRTIDGVAWVTRLRPEDA